MTTLKSLALVSGDVPTVLVCVVVGVLACVDVGLISIVRWLVQRVPLRKDRA